jgi:hypothetical protein
MVPLTFLFKMISISSALPSVEKASAAYKDSAIPALSLLDAPLPALDCDDVLSSSFGPPDIALTKAPSISPTVPLSGY